MRRLRILAIDDEPALLRIIKDSLSSTYDVAIVESAKDAFTAMFDQTPDLILVDNIMPGFNGVDFVKTVRSAANTKNIPIVMLTALKESEDRMEAYRAGVDDFISKPFNPDELLIRVQARLHRTKDIKEQNSSKKEIGNLSLDFENHTVRIDEKPIHLTQVELIIVDRLIADQNQIVKRETLEKLIWGSKVPQARILDIHMATLRKKLKNFNLKIETVYGQGFVIRNLDQ